MVAGLVDLAVALVAFLVGAGFAAMGSAAERRGRERAAVVSTSLPRVVTVSGTVERVDALTGVLAVDAVFFFGGIVTDDRQTMR